MISLANVKFDPVRHKPFLRRNDVKGQLVKSLQFKNEVNINTLTVKFRNIHFQIDKTSYLEITAIEQFYYINVFLFL